MSTFAAKLDRFVRWFFNVSPTTTSIEPRPPRRRSASSPRRARPASPTGSSRCAADALADRCALERRGGRMNTRTPALKSPLVRRGAVGTAAMIALVLLGVFYSVVAGAVDRAATQRRAAIQLEAAARAAADARFAARPVLAVQTPPRLPQRYAPRNVAYRSSN